MQIFINECSLVGQYVVGGFLPALTTLIACVSRLSDIKNGKGRQFAQIPSAVLVDRNSIQFKYGEKDKLLTKSIHALSPDRQQLFYSVVFNEPNAKNWREEQLHTMDNEYYCSILHRNVADSTPAEAAERKLRTPATPILLLNFGESPYKEHSINRITKNNEEQAVASLACADSEEAVKQWLQNIFGITYTYTDTNRPPLDAETILCDDTRFQRTSLLSPHGRRTVYYETRTGHYWYVDNFHQGQRAHLEVFTAQGKHIGEADINTGAIKPDTQDLAKIIGNIVR